MNIWIVRGERAVKLRRTRMMLTGLVFLVMILLLRTTGIHCDENNYLSLAANTLLGDSTEFAKPVLFYLVNYGTYHLLGPLLGPLRFMSPYLLGCVLFPVCLMLATRPLGSGGKKRTLAFFFLLSSPLILTNATQLMMEALVLPPLAVVAMLAFQRQRSLVQDITLMACGTVAVAAKGTAAVALLALAAIFLHKGTRRTTWLICWSIVAGYHFHRLSLSYWVHPKSVLDYGGPDGLLRFEAVMLRTRVTRQYLYAWLWFGGAVMATASVFSLLPEAPPTMKAPRRPIPTAQEVALLSLGSLAGVFVIQLIQRIPPYGEMVRYCYPAIFVALVPTVVFLAERSPKILIVALAFNLLGASALVRRDTNRFALWPSLYVFETVQSGGSIFTGFPIHGLVLRQTLKSTEPCVTINDQVTKQWTTQFLHLAWPGMRGTGCGKPDFYFSEQPISPEGASGSCEPLCSGYSSRACAFQEIKYSSNYFGELRRDLCWSSN